MNKPEGGIWSQGQVSYSIRRAMAISRICMSTQSALCVAITPHIALSLHTFHTALSSACVPFISILENLHPFPHR